MHTPDSAHCTQLGASRDPSAKTPAVTHPLVLVAPAGRTFNVTRAGGFDAARPDLQPLPLHRAPGVGWWVSLSLAIPDKLVRCGEDVYAAAGIPREDRPARLRQFARNYALFGAPVGLFFAMDRNMGLGQWADLGMFMQNIMLLAREHGLHTCAQESWAVWHKTLAKYLGLPAERMLFCGMALGHGDAQAAINTVRTERAPLAEFATLRGF